MIQTNNNPERNCCTCQVRSPLFRFLSQEELERIERSRIIVRFKKGETIRKQGTFMSHVLFLNEGLAKLYIEGYEQRNAIIRIVKPTNFIGGPGIYLDQMHHFTVTALMDTTVCFIEVSVFKKIIETNINFLQEFMKDFSRNILSIYNRLLCLTQKQMPGRMADTLLYLRDEIFESLDFPMVISRNDLSELSGMSKESAMKVLREFQHEGLICISDRRMQLLNPDALIRISKIG